jgi:hypothetical protein
MSVLDPLSPGAELMRNTLLRASDAEYGDLFRIVLFGGTLPAAAPGG